MKPNPIYLSVHSPCHEKWSDMTATTAGAFCQSCSKEVVDFSRMSDREVIAYLSTHQLSCGRFRKDQLDTPISVSEPDNGAFQWRALLLGLLPMLAWRALPAATLSHPVSDQQPALADKKKDTIAAPAIVVPDSVVICGLITDYGIEPVAGAEVTVHYPAGGYTGNGMRTDSNGCFELHLTREEFKYGVPYLRATNDRYEDKTLLTTEAVQNVRLFLSSGQMFYTGGAMWHTTFLAVPLREGIFQRLSRAVREQVHTSAQDFTVFGTVWDGREPLRDVSIRVLDSAGAFYGNGAVTDTAGAYSIQISRSEERDRKYYLEYSLDDHYIRRIPLEKAATKRLDISLPALGRYPTYSVDYQDISRTDLFFRKLHYRFRKLFARHHHK